MKKITNPDTKTANTGTKTVVRDVEDVLDKVPYCLEFRQFRRKGNIKIAAMYTLYLQGKSLAYIAEVVYRGRFTRKALFEVFKTRGYKLRSKKLKPAKIYKGVEYRPDGDGLYRSRIKGKTVYLHRLIWEEINGEIPFGHYVIFKDGNKDNVAIENLKCISDIEAKRKLYNHANQFGYKRYKDKGSFGIGASK